MEQRKQDGRGRDFQSDQVESTRRQATNGAVMKVPQPRRLGRKHEKADHFSCMAETYRTRGRSVDRYEDSGCSQCALENPYERLLACSIPPQPFRSYVANGKFLLHSRPSQPIYSPFLHNGKFLLLSLPICLEPRSKSLQLHHSCSPALLTRMTGFSHGITFRWT